MGRFATYAQVLLDHKQEGALFQMGFLRVVLDEADKIKKLGAKST